MHHKHSDRIAIPLLPLVALLAISIAFLPLHTAHAAPQRPLGTGCSASEAGWNFYFGGGMNSQLFENNQNYNCSSTNNSVTLEFVLHPGPIAYINAQGDTWQTHLVGPSGARHCETGRSGLATYPDNGQVYWVQESNCGYLPPPLWGCNWVNFPDYNRSYDYLCVPMR
jgi:hypothetical protein